MNSYHGQTFTAFLKELCGNASFAPACWPNWVKTFYTQVSRCDVNERWHPGVCSPTGSVTDQLLGCPAELLKASTFTLLHWNKAGYVQESARLREKPLLFHRNLLGYGCRHESLSCRTSPACLQITSFNICPKETRLKSHPKPWYARAVTTTPLALSTRTIRLAC